MFHTKKIHLIILLATIVGCHPIKLKGPSETARLPDGRQVRRVTPLTLDERIKVKNDMVSLTLRDDDLQSVLSIISKKSKRNIFFPERIYSRVSADFKDINVRDVFNILVSGSAYTVEHYGNYCVVKLRKADEQNVVTKVIKLRYTLAKDILKALMDSFVPVGESKAVMNKGQRLFPVNAFMLHPNEEVTEEISEFSIGDIERKKKTTKKEQIATRVSLGSGNSVVVSGKDNKVRHITEWIMQMDREVPQVYFETEILEFDVLALKSLGINLLNYINAINGINTDLTLNLSPKSSDSNLNKRVNTPVIQSFTLTASGSDKLDMLAENTHAKIIGHPTLKITSGKEGKITFKEKRFVQIKALQAAELKEVEAGVSMKLTPFVTEDNSIIVKLYISNSLFLPEVSEDIFASTSVSEALTEIKVKSGEAIVIGGITTERSIKNISGIPYLRELPVFGYLFGKTSISVERIETIFKIIPHLIPNPTT